MTRIFLFIFSVGAAGCLVAAAMALPKDGAAAVLYLIGAIFLALLAGHSWKRLAAAIRTAPRKDKTPLAR